MTIWRSRSRRHARHAASHEEKETLENFIRRPQSRYSDKEAPAQPKVGMVEARGVEPLSEDRQCTVSTCVADNLSFAAIHACRPA
ncbi:hypothetical protein COMA2_250006 [Candidatus Nitrospira nitrificans]|uniref:Uncharacterized protein n=1 Tax=Candidatus Nitrospira nitrificans TaxID=1742973 RepID=A0A0S4LHD9_9BACT|nr:hypothetical protein COMA2_250006 [Candidatus Nitrospira nitrificans]